MDCIKERGLPTPWQWGPKRGDDDHDASWLPWPEAITCGKIELWLS